MVSTATRLTHSGEGMFVDLDLVDFHPDNPRGPVDPDAPDIVELAKSIGEIGLLEDLVLGPGPEPGRFYLICGERRTLACRRAGLVKGVPAKFREDLVGAAAIFAMLTENGQRKNLTPLQEARAIGRLLELGETQQQIAKRLGRTQGHVSKRRRLLDLPVELQERVGLVGPHGLTIDDALALADVAGDEQILAAALEPTLFDTPPLPGAYRERVEQASAQVDAARRDQTVRAELEQAGVRLIDPHIDTWSRLDEAGLPGEDEHAGEPCHAAWVGNGRPVYVCTDPARHQPPPAPARPAPVRAGADAEARRTRQLLRQARDDRAEVWRRLFARPVGKDLALTLLVRYASWPSALYYGLGSHDTARRAASWLPAGGPQLAELDPTQRAAMLAAAAVDRALTETYHEWSDVESQTLALLEQRGYQPCEIEELCRPKDAAA